MTSVIPTIRDIIVICTGIAGFAFGIYKYLKSREAETALELEVECNTLSFQEKNIHELIMTLSNIGKSASFADRKKSKKALCLINKVFTVQEGDELTWDRINTDYLIEPIEYMKEWFPPDGSDKPMIFEPGSKEVFRIFFSTNYQGPIWVRIEFEDIEGYKWRTNRIFILPPKAAIIT